MADIKAQFAEVQKQAETVIADVQVKAGKVVEVAQTAANDAVALSTKTANELSVVANKQIAALKADGSVQDKLNAQKALVAEYPTQLKAVADSAVELANKVAGNLKAAVA